MKLAQFLLFSSALLSLSPVSKASDFEIYQNDRFPDGRFIVRGGGTLSVVPGSVRCDLLGRIRAKFVGLPKEAGPWRKQSISAPFLYHVATRYGEDLGCRDIKKEVLEYIELTNNKMKSTFIYSLNRKYAGYCSEYDDPNSVSKCRILVKRLDVKLGWLDDIPGYSMPPFMVSQPAGRLK